MRYGNNGSMIQVVLGKWVGDSDISGMKKREDEFGLGSTEFEVPNICRK